MANQKHCNAAWELLGVELRAGKPIAMHAVGNSMAPTILPGDILQIAPCLATDLHSGDIVVLRTGKEPVVHRLRAIEKRGDKTLLLTKGDHIECPADPPVSPAAIFGKVNAVARREKFAQPFFHTDALLWQASFCWTADVMRQVKRHRWKKFLAEARREGLAEIIALKALTTSDNPNVFFSAAERSQLESIRRTAAARNTIALQQLADVLAALHDTPVIILKGAALAAHIYQSPAMRLFTDIDLLIEPTMRQKAIECLKKSGYCPDGQSASQYLHSLCLRGEKKFPIHLHWHLANSVRPEYSSTAFDMEEIWLTSIALASGGQRLSPEYFLLHLADHAVRHSFARLIWLRDAAELIIAFHDKLDWSRFVRICQKAGLADRAYQVLFYVSRMTPVGVPEEVLRQLQPTPFPFSNRLFRRLALDGCRLPEAALLLDLPKFTRTTTWRAYLQALFLPPASGQTATREKWRRLCLRAYRHLPLSTKIIWTWAIRMPAVLLIQYLRRSWSAKWQRSSYG